MSGSTADDRLPDPDAPERSQITVGDLIQMCQQEAQRLGTKQRTKRTRLLLMNAAYAMKQLVERLSVLEDRFKLLN